jgi:Tfp pilus assembly protein PilV
MIARIPRNRLPARRGGLTLIEVLVTAVLLAAAISTAVPLLGWMAAEHRSAERHQWALQELNNVLERFAQLPWANITPEAAREQTLSLEGAQRLPGGELKLLVDDLATTPASKRLRAEVRWRGASGELTAPLRLTAWIYEQRRSK